MAEKKKEGKQYQLLELIRSGAPLSWRQRLDLIVRLSIPAMLAQISLTIMLYIDASMVGSLGAEASAAIGLVSTTTWLFGGLLVAGATAFSVQVAHRLGAGDKAAARSIMRQAFVVVSLYGLVLGAIGCGISGSLPRWLGGNADIVDGASGYFLIYAASLPLMQLSVLSGSLLRVTGNMQVPSALNILMCVLDVIFNALLIFPSRDVDFGFMTVWLPGADMGVRGAALGTALAECVTAVLMTLYLWLRSPELGLRNPGSWHVTRTNLRAAFKLGGPIGMERVIMCGAQIMSTVIVAPLGTVAIAANAFAITAESLCYMPGFGIGEAATTIIGQCVGAGRKRLTRELGYLSVGLGMAVMAVMGVVMYVFAPEMIGLMSPDSDIRLMGTDILRIESYAEPMFAAAIVSYGVFVGAGDTLLPSCMNFGSIWLVRLTLAALLAPTMGLHGVWVAMCVELCFRGTIFLARLRWGNWLHIKTEEVES